MTPADVATLSLLDPDLGVCPDDHGCRLDAILGYRNCDTCDYRGMALICWGVTDELIQSTERAGAAKFVTEWARSFLADRTSAREP